MPCGCKGKVVALHPYILIPAPCLCTSSGVCQTPLQTSSLTRQKKFQKDKLLFSSGLINWFGSKEGLVSVRAKREANQNPGSWRDDLEAFIWNYFIEQSLSCSYSILSFQLVAILNQNGIWLSHPTLPILYRSTEYSNIEACGFEGIVQSTNNSSRSNDGQRCWKTF